MKLLYTSNDVRTIGMLRSVLDEAGIAYEVRNETMPYPGAIFDPEVWVIEDGEFTRACGLRDVATRLPPVSQAPWTCPSCGEKLEGQFGSCWKCGANRNAGS
jgi:Putative prokaryotic signal transducing protein